MLWAKRKASTDAGDPSTPTIIIEIVRLSMAFSIVQTVGAPRVPNEPYDR